MEMYIRKINLNPIAAEKPVEPAIDLIGIHQVVPNSCRDKEVREIFGRNYRPTSIIPEVYDQLPHTRCFELGHQLIELVFHTGWVTPVIECGHEYVKRKIPYFFVRHIANALLRNRHQSIISPLHIPGDLFAIRLTEYKADLTGI